MSPNIHMFKSHIHNLSEPIQTLDESALFWNTDTYFYLSGSSMSCEKVRIRTLRSRLIYHASFVLAQLPPWVCRTQFSAWLGLHLTFPIVLVQEVCAYNPFLIPWRQLLLDSRAARKPKSHLGCQRRLSSAGALPCPNLR